ncbi:MAG: methyltransferase domain-containing protein [Verrucomicrobia bacterium]|nr:methyltransferase domain-containing protein [Verrucomicrobiota bacterium]
MGEVFSSVPFSGRKPEAGRKPVSHLWWSKIKIPIPPSMPKKLAAWLAQGRLFARGRRLYAENRQNWNMPLSKLDKLRTGLYLILDDYAKGLFPPTFRDQQIAYANEIAYRNNLGGTTVEQSLLADMRKPFWAAKSTAKFLGDFARLLTCIERCGVLPPAHVLELGCGSGWTAEFLAVRGYAVTGTSIAEVDIAAARKRIASLQAKGLNSSLRFELAPMETVAEVVGPKEDYDVVLVYEALHHAFDWRKALESSFACLKPGGWLIVCSEPNLLRTFISYRVAKLSNTREIGFSRGELLRHLRHSGYRPIRYLGSRFHFWIKNHWICAQKPCRSQ